MIVATVMGGGGEGGMTVHIQERPAEPDSPVPLTSGLHLPGHADTSQVDAISSPVASNSGRHLGHETVSSDIDDAVVLIVSPSCANDKA